MIVAAGVLIIAPDPRTGADTVLMLLRGDGSDHPFEWAFPGGHVEAGETTQQGAARECAEECGLELKAEALGEVWTRGVAKAEFTAPVGGDPAGTPVAPSEDVDFTTYVVRLKEQFEPELCDEHVAWCWAPLAYPPGPTHPGAQVGLSRFTMHELDVARAIAEGRLMSPVHYENVWLFAMRITGTGAAYRAGLKEFVWREPAEWLNDDFLARCNGLQVIWVHPKGATLDSQEFARRSIGAIFLPYLKDEEVWGVAKIYDDEAAQKMRDQQVSTSPTVVFGPESGAERVTLETGQRILIEGRPRLLDHLAICAAGVWDKGLDPVGVDRAAALMAEPVADAAWSEGDHPRAPDGQFYHGTSSANAKVIRTAGMDPSKSPFRVNYLTESRGEASKYSKLSSRSGQLGSVLKINAKGLDPKLLKKDPTAGIWQYHGHIDPKHITEDAERASTCDVLGSIVAHADTHQLRGRLLSLRARNLTIT